ncbi:hypothetical protein MHK_006272, partial [Candidatus Magnetomorum sp. HK-1]
ASITFTVAEDIIQQDLDTSCSIKLLRRDETSGGLWKVLDCSSAVYQSTHQVRFDGITQDGQYILGRTNGIPVAGAGKSIVFDGKDTAFIINDIFEDVPPSFTIEWFMNPNSLSNATKPFSIGAVEGFDAFVFYCQNDGSIIVGTDEKTSITTQAGLIHVNSWQHVAFTYQSGIGKFYINGTLIK